MISPKNLVILNVFIFLISSSVGGRLLEKRSATYEYEDYEDEPPPTPARRHSNEDSGECEETFTPHVECQHEGILIVLSHDTHQGKFFVSDHQDDKDCMKVFSKSSQNTSLKIPFGKCGLDKSAEVNLNITVLPNDKILGHGAATIPVKCPYLPHNSTVSDDLPLKEIPYHSHAPINATGPPEPKYTLTITEHDGPKKKKMVHADIQISPEVANARAKKCFAYAKNDTSIRQELTDKDGCPINPNIFPGWQWNKEGNKLESKFPSFQLVGADKTGMNCTVMTCFTESDCGVPCPKADSQRRKCKGRP